MNQTGVFQATEYSGAHNSKGNEKNQGELLNQVTTVVGSEEGDYELPTEADLANLRRVRGKIPWAAYSVGFIELCERFSYYGTTAVFVNFIQQPLPTGSTTGAGFEGQSGALGMGQRASTGITTFNAFWAYIMPLFGAYMAEKYWGRFKTIQWSILVALVGHFILIVSAIPAVIVHPKLAISFFTVGLVIMGIGVGGFKSNVAPLIAEQCPETQMRIKTTKTGERVIMDPSITVSTVYVWFYLMINIGSLLGSVGMVYAEKYVGFWLSFLMPTIMLLICPFVMWGCKKHYILTPPTGSVLGNALKLGKFALSKSWSWNPFTLYRNCRKPAFWKNVKPSHLDSRPAWMTFDDEWADEVRRGFLACKVFLWFPIYWLAYGQMVNNLTSQAAVMQLNGVPNDIVSNLNPIFIVVFCPLMNLVIYPGLRSLHINFTPIKRITCGFALASFSMVSACVTQYYIYKLGPCGMQANSCKDASGNRIGAPISVWVQIVPYALIGFSEIMASITSLEYAYTKAPQSMRSTIQAVSLFMTSISSALAQALVALAEDPYLVWNYGIVAVLAGVGGILFWLDNRRLDKEEDALNNLPMGNLVQDRKPSVAVMMGSSADADAICIDGHGREKAPREMAQDV